MPTQDDIANRMIASMVLNDNFRTGNLADVQWSSVCEFCGVPLTPHMADADLIVEYAGYRFCSDGCVENWVDLQDL